MSQDLYTLSKIFKAVSDPSRINILVLLSVRPHCVCELAQILKFSQPSISKHLQILLDAGFISFKKNKNFMIYTLTPKDKFIEDLLNLIFDKLKTQSIYTEIAEKTTPVPIFFNDQILKREEKC